MFLKPHQIVTRVSTIRFVTNVSDEQSSQLTPLPRARPIESISEASKTKQLQK